MSWLTWIVPKINDANNCENEPGSPITYITGRRTFLRRSNPGHSLVPCCHENSGNGSDTAAERVDHVKSSHSFQLQVMPGALGRNSRYKPGDDRD
ncbi:hypothetical protein PAXRUDRAFT_823238 [Paxillus rubicundulus Ve08.2h10]|uniref:Uncharacterized protein n=1 Tax=Paxillus rubicundulus Ve08.2h10 TaxID=930991 RepID=A0A0D0ECA2_9AGAM|nr:hypothetical protein PAXRUDRAFT_823238 [Paxillus rubicundulus Ve08.2h10]